MISFEREFNDNDCRIERSDASPDTKVTIIQCYWPSTARAVASLVRFGIDPLWEPWLKYANNRNWLSTDWAQLKRVNSENNTDNRESFNHQVDIWDDDENWSE